MILIVNVTVQAIEKFNCCHLHRVDPLHEYRETLERQAFVLEATVLRWNLKKKDWVDYQTFHPHPSLWVFLNRSLQQCRCCYPDQNTLLWQISDEQILMFLLTKITLKNEISPYQWCLSSDRRRNLRVCCIRRHGFPQ